MLFKTILDCNQREYFSRSSLLCIPGEKGERFEGGGRHHRMMVDPPGFLRRLEGPGQSRWLLPRCNQQPRPGGDGRDQSLELRTPTVTVTTK